MSKVEHIQLQILDGNGRVGRLFLNMMLFQDGYPPARMLRDWRQRSIQARQQASAGDYQAIIDLVGQAVELSLDRYLQVCQEATTHLLSMKKLAPIFETTVDYPGQLARAGKFAAQKRGSYWYASVEDVARYFHDAQTRPRGRPRKKRPEAYVGTPGAASYNTRETAMPMEVDSSIRQSLELK